MRVGMIGYPQVGKTTLFTMMTKAQENAGACLAGRQAGSQREESRIGIARVYDPRLGTLAAAFNPKKVTPATVECIDLGGFENKESLRNVDALVHVVRAFHDDMLPHSRGGVNPVADIHAMELELIVADLAWIEDRITKLERDVKKRPNDALKTELALQIRLRSHLELERPLRELHLRDDERRTLNGYGLLSLKPILFVLNVGEESGSAIDHVVDHLGLSTSVDRQHTRVVALNGKLETELSQLTDEDARIFMADLGFNEPGLDRMVRESYALLGLISFFTVGPKEVRAWTVRRGTRAKHAAGAIHSDIERGFIRAEVVHYDDFMQYASFPACKEKGKVHLEGKDYEVIEGDIITFRFNV